MPAPSAAAAVHSPSVSYHKRPANAGGVVVDRALPLTTTRTCHYVWVVRVITTRRPSSPLMVPLPQEEGIVSIPPPSGKMIRCAVEGIRWVRMPYVLF